MNDIIYADVPKDLMKIKTKFLFNLTKRQLCCFGAAVLSHPGRAAPHGVHAAHDRRHDTLLSVRAV